MRVFKWCSTILKVWLDHQQQRRAHAPLNSLYHTLHTPSLNRNCQKSFQVKTLYRTLNCDLRLTSYITGHLWFHFIISSYHIYHLLLYAVNTFKHLMSPQQQGILAVLDSQRTYISWRLLMAQIGRFYPPYKACNQTSLHLMPPYSNRVIVITLQGASKNNLFRL